MGVLAPAASVCVNPDWTGGAGKWGGGGAFENAADNTVHGSF